MLSLGIAATIVAACGWAAAKWHSAVEDHMAALDGEIEDLQERVEDLEALVAAREDEE